jgi:hypothetical protein
LQLWLGMDERGSLTASGIYQVITRRGEQAGVAVLSHRFRHHFCHTCLDRGGREGDLAEPCGWTSPRMLRVWGASARSARARHSYDRVMGSTRQDRAGKGRTTRHHRHRNPRSDRSAATQD